MVSFRGAVCKVTFVTHSECDCNVKPPFLLFGATDYRLPIRLSCHQTDLTHGRTVNMSIFSTTIPLEGRSTCHHMNSIRGRSICQAVTPVNHYPTMCNVCSPGQRSNAASPHFQIVPWYLDKIDGKMIPIKYHLIWAVFSHLPLQLQN